MSFKETELFREIKLLDKVFLNLLSDTNDVSDAGLLQLPEILLASGSVGSEEEARDDLLHVSPHGVGPVINRSHHEAISLNVNILTTTTTFSGHLYQDIWDSIHCTIMFLI